MVQLVLGALSIAGVFAWVSFLNLVFILFGGTVSTTLELTLPEVLGAVAFLFSAYAGGLPTDKMTRKRLMIFIGSAQIPPFCCCISHTAFSYNKDVRPELGTLQNPRCPTRACRV